MGVNYPYTSAENKSAVDHKWAKWLHNPCCLGDPHCFKATKSEVAHKWATWLHNPYCLGVPDASERCTKLEVAHKWTGWLQNSYQLGGLCRFRAREKIRSGPQVGKVPT